MNARIALRRLLSAAPLWLAVFLLAGAPAWAERVQGRFTFQDYGNSSAVVPINDAKVEIWRYKPGFLGIWGWSMDKRVWTDANGWIDVDMPWAASGVIYAVRVYGANAHITVWPQDTAHVGESWYQELPQQTVTNSSAVLDFTYHFDAWYAARNFNIARVGWIAGEYMTYTYGALSTVNAQATDIYPKTFYDPSANTIQMNLDRDFNDFAIAHEYGHFVQEQIGSLPWEPAVHSLCVPSDPSLAWMEGFADFFPYAVARVYPGELAGGGIGTSIESGSLCAKTTPDSTEYFVAATLFDLVDNGSGLYSSSEPHDWTAGNDWLILSILDNELGAFGSTPTIWDFRNAWAARGQSLTNLDRILAKHGIVADFNLASFASQSVPTSMIAGRQYTVRVVMQNSGSTNWTAADGYRLGSQNPQDNLTWGLHRVDTVGTVVPGQNAVFDFTVTAPSTPGSYPFQWRMVREGVEWFGDYTPSVQVAVTAALQSAQFVSQSVPTSMDADSTYTVSVTMRNNGDTTWTPGTYFLGSQNAQDNTAWGLNRVSLPNSVGPGGQVTFTFDVTAPSWSGNYNFQWKMLQNGVGWFGDASTNVVVKVTAPPPVCDSTACVDDCISSGCRGGKCNSYGSCVCLYCL